MAVVPNWHGIDLEWAYGGLLRAIVRRTRCGHRAKDALHDAFVRFAGRPDPRNVVEPQAYFRSVVQSVLADQHREAQRIVLLDDGSTPAEKADASPHCLDEQALLMGLYQPSAQDLYAIGEPDSAGEDASGLARARQVLRGNFQMGAAGIRRPQYAGLMPVWAIARTVRRKLLEAGTARELIGGAAIE